ncbi:MAG: hypothetical protein RLZZ28_2020 [Bacteroidota bacterium]|jgi:undecaprenyl-diphosphatase
MKKTNPRLIRFACLCIFIGSFLSGSRAQNFDINLLKNINPQYPDSKVWQGFSNTSGTIGAGLPLGMLAISLIKKDPAMRSRSLEMVGSFVLTAVATEAVKTIINRDRPYIKYPLDVFPYDNSETGKSFPSGHTALSFATATSLYLNYPKWYVAVPAFAWATGVAYSRMYLGEHYPTDVLTGAAFGIAGAYTSHWLNKKLHARKKK